MLRAMLCFFPFETSPPEAKQVARTSQPRFREIHPFRRGGGVGVACSAARACLVRSCSWRNLGRIFKKLSDTMSKKRKANDKALPEAPNTKIKVEPGLESKTRYVL